VRVSRGEGGDIVVLVGAAPSLSDEGTMIARRGKLLIDVNSAEQAVQLRGRLIIYAQHLNLAG
jgi:hypothetical protein